MHPRTPDLHAIAALEASRAARRRPGVAAPPDALMTPLPKLGPAAEVQLAQAAQMRRALRRMDAQEASRTPGADAP